MSLFEYGRKKVGMPKPEDALPGRPLPLELNVRHFRPVSEISSQRLQVFAARIGGVDDEGVGQGILRQAGDDLGHSLGALQALQCRVA